MNPVRTRSLESGDRLLEGLSACTSEWFPSRFIERSRVAAISEFLPFWNRVFRSNVRTPATMDNSPRLAGEVQTSPRSSDSPWLDIVVEVRLLNVSGSHHDQFICKVQSLMEPSALSGSVFSMPKLADSHRALSTKPTPTASRPARIHLLPLHFLPSHCHSMDSSR